MIGYLYFLSLLIMIDYKNKYLKYKLKYNNLKKYLIDKDYIGGNVLDNKY